MSIYLLEDYINTCKVFEVEKTRQGLHKWKNQMWRE